MGQVRLGKLLLRWCPSCNLPILEERACGSCGGPTDQVTLTPPGDVRPATAADLERVRKVADRQFGDGAGRALLPEDEAVVVLNKAPDLDRMDEVILDGRVVAAMRYDPLSGWRLLPRLEGAARLAPSATAGVVGLSEDAVPFIEDGKSVLAPGVATASDSIKAGDEVIVVGPDRRPVAVGTARMLGKKMVEESHGVCVKVRHHRYPGDETPGPGRVRTWDEALEANRGHMDRMVGRATSFVERTVAREGLPLAVSFSGGKDSLATLLLVLEAGLRPPMVFVDTGIELPGTVEHVREVAHRHDLELVLEGSGQDFIALSRRFGPPSRDHRWCCKTQKLGPVARALTRRFPGGVLTFIGQRRYESGPRSRSGAVWRNPWVPGQVGASPIQDWTALHVWLFLRMRGEAANVWYGLGLERIGCYPCPATDLADLETVERRFEGYQEWREALEGWAEATGRDRTWVDLGLWRFKRPPKALVELHPGGRSATTGREPGPALGLVRGRPVEGAEHGPAEARGAFDGCLDMERAAELLRVLGEVGLDAEAGVARVGEVVEVSADGEVVARGEDARAAADLLEVARQLVVKAQLCVGCGVCLPRCPTGALSVEDRRVRVDGALCTSCRSCLGPCAVVDFPPLGR